MLDKYAALARELGRLSTANDLRMKDRSDPDFTNQKVFERLGSKAELVRLVRDHCGITGAQDVVALCDAYSPRQSVGPRPEHSTTVAVGSVYLLKSGRHYKIGRSNSVGRREHEVSLQLPERVTTLHTITTDDPVGIEAYWHGGSKRNERTASGSNSMPRTLRRSGGECSRRGGPRTLDAFVVEGNLTRMKTHSSPTYVIVAKGRSAAVFAEQEEWTVRAFPAGRSRVDVTFRTQYVSGGFEAKTPRAMYAEVSGQAESLEDAIQRFPNAARSLAPIFDVALNASVDDLDLHFGFDATPELHEREFFQSFVRDAALTPRRTRPVSTALLSHLTEAIARHPDNVRLHRAAAHYQQALRFWGFGDETRAVSQLWMGFEALTPVAKRCELERTATESSGDLARVMGVDERKLEPALRRVVLFRGDDTAYRATNQASNGFEHGFMPLDELRVLARGTRDASAAYLRRAIIELSGVDSAVASEALAAPYDWPIIGFPITKYLRGKLRGAGEVAPAGQRYPSVTWRTDIEEFSHRSEGGHNLRWKEHVTPKLAPGIVLTDISIEMWSGDKLPEGPRVTMKGAEVVRSGASRDVSTGAASQATPRGWASRLRDFIRRLRP